MAHRPNPPSHKEIVRWWIDNHADEWPDHPQRYDWGEPVCWACEGMAGDSWSHPRLEKAHLVDHALGGANDPSNFVLLCNSCHHDMPRGLFGPGHRQNALAWIKCMPTWLQKVQLFADRFDQLNEVEKANFEAMGREVMQRLREMERVS